MKSIKIFQDVLNLEAKALISASTKIQEGHIQFLENFFVNLRENDGALYFSGVGKSGHIAQKLASTFSSIGLASHFIHPVEALHGDLGRLKKRDGLIIISKSGTTEELERFLPFSKVDKNHIIGLLGDPEASLAKWCSLVLDCSVEKEACLNNQAPTASSTLAMAMGDSIAVLYEYLIGLDKYSFAKNHPGGLLGKSLSLKVKDLMIPSKACATCTQGEVLRDVLLTMTKCPLGACAILSEGNILEGLVVEGDIRRSLMNNDSNLSIVISKIMNNNPIKINQNDMAIKALELMEKRKNPVYVIPVVDEDNIFKGIIRMHDLVKEGLK